MPITDPYVLPNDVLLIPVPELPEGVRAKLTYKEGDLAITRPHVRAPSKIIGARSAALLRQFQSPKTIVAAVLEYCRETTDDPQRVLEQALPFLKNLIDSRVLLEAGSPDAERITPTLSPGDVFETFEIIDAVHVVEDTEVFQARGHSAAHPRVALKVTRPRDGVDLASIFEREAAVLRHLAGDPAPLLVASGVASGRSFLAVEWIEGLPAPVLAAELLEATRASAAPERAAEARARLHSLVVGIAEAYARLHGRGVIHSDVHPNNLLVDEAGEVHIIDFGYARFLDERHPLSSAPRAGVGFYFEPECAEALLSGRREPPSSLPGEQYAVAGVLYQLLTGGTHLDFSLRYEEMLRQIAGADPRPWSAHDVSPWPEMENVVRTALDRDPRRRFPSMQAFARRLRAVAAPSAQAAPVAPLTAAREHAVAGGAPQPSHLAFIDRVLARVQPDGDLFRGSIGEGQPVPTASADHGAAGIAYAVLRLASRRGDPQLLALADLWITKTERVTGDERAFYNASLEITRESVADVSLHHMPPGVHFVRALVSDAMADPLNAQRAVERFVADARRETDSLDLTLGRTSVLHGCTLLTDSLGEGRFAAMQDVVQLGDDILDAVWTRLDGFGPVAESEELTYLGVAHGWAGLLYASLRWTALRCASKQADFGSSLPKGTIERLRQLARCGVPSGRGMLWPWFNAAAGGQAAAGVMPGWCNGNAGHVFLWTLAHQLLGTDEYLDLARRAAWGLLDQQVHFNNLCCGAGGCAYALLSLYRHTGDTTWLTQARRYASRVVSIPEPPAERPTDIHSLFKGEVGTMVLLDDLAEPERARMPLFE